MLEDEQPFLSAQQLEVLGDPGGLLRRFVHRVHNQKMAVAIVK
jgi:hypothetical protein